MSYTLAGISREAFSRFPMPANTALFEPTFKDKAVVRLDDVTADPRYGLNAPEHRLTADHVPVRSYLAVPVRATSGEVLAGLFFGHSRVGVFRPEHEQLALESRRGRP